MSEFPFAIQCSIQENQLIRLKDSINGCLNSIWLTNVPGIKYRLSIYPNGNTDEYRGETWIFLQVKLDDDVKKVKANFTISIESAKFSEEWEHIYEKSIGRGIYVDAEEFFDPENKFIVDGNVNVKINGTFKFENGDSDSGTNAVEQQKWEGGELGDVLWGKDDSKDFTIFVDGKEIKVHKLILGSRSEVFSAMLKPHTKESMENKVEIMDFSSDVVETAVKMIYQSNFVTSLSLDEMMSLLQFFDKYSIPSLKEKVELLLIYRMSATSVCRLANCSVLTYSSKLKKKCIEFLMVSSASKTALKDIEILDKDIGMEVLQSSLYRVVDIL